MLTPRALAELLLDLDRADGRTESRLKAADLTVVDVRSLCLGIKWLAEGVYAWISDEERAAIYAMAARLETMPRPAGMTETPEEKALALLERFETMPTDVPAGVTQIEVTALCRALLELAEARYAYPLSASARAVHATRVAAAEPESVPA